MSVLPVAPRLLLLCCLLGALFGACEVRHQRSEPELVVPPGSGQVSIDMTGVWRMTQLVHMSTPRGLPPANPVIEPLRPGSGVIPPAEDALLVIADAAFSTGNGQSMAFEDISVRRGDESYLNQADGQVARFDYHFEDRVKSTFSTFRILVGAVDHDTMLGYMFFFGYELPDGTQPGEGLYSFTLQRQ